MSLLILNLFYLGKDCFIRSQSLLADLPCKSQLLNHIQFNGYYGCTHCFIPGRYDHDLKKMLFEPWNIPYTIFSLKTKNDYIELSELAEKKNMPICGIKGSSVFAKTLDLELTKKVPFDAMHLIFEGHTKFFLKRLVPKYKLISKF